MLITIFRRPLRHALRTGVALAAAGLLSVTPAAAADSDVLARVDGTEITQGEVDMATQMFAEQLAQVPEEQRRTMVLDALIDMHVVAGAARKAGLEEGEAHKARMEFLTNQALRTAYLEEMVEKAITDDELKARYDKDIASFTPPEEVHAAHILVKTEEEAKQVIDDLAKGGDFAAIAKEKSLDPGSKENGGDLGFFAKGQMVPEFEAEAFALPVGETSKAPVKSQFGFHVVKVLEKRTQPVPTFEQVREQLLPALQREKFQQVMGDLKAAAKVERMDTAAAEGASPAEGAPPAEGTTPPEGTTAPEGAAPTEGTAPAQ
jgi:peptidyl-prolyl cis-trans isomerase C